MQTVRTEFELTPILRLSLKKPTQLLQDKLQPTIQRSFWASNRHREEKSLLHVSMVAKFLDEQHLTSFNLSNVGEIFWFKSERTVSKLGEKKENFCVVLHKAGA